MNISHFFSLSPTLVAVAIWLDMRAQNAINAHALNKNLAIATPYLVKKHLPQTTTINLKMRYNLTISHNLIHSD